MTLLLAFMGVAKAETIEIGTGTGTTYMVPFNSLYGYSFTEQIFTASEIGAAGNITSISFNLGQSYTAEQTNDVVLYMKNVSRETFTATTDYEPVTTGNKWAMVDTDMGGHYVTDRNGIPLSLKEMRENYISGEKMLMHPAFGKAQKDNDYYAYMAKNTYWFSCWGTLSYYQEDYKVEGIDRNSYVNLIPSGYTPYGIDEGYIVTTDAEKFWDASMSE